MRMLKFLGILLVPVLGSGCLHPFSMGVFLPVAVPPWTAEYIEERCMNKNDHRAAVLPPIPPAYRPQCEDPPDRAEILRAMPRVARGVPYIYEEFRDDIDFMVEKIADVVDPPRFFPMMGPAQLHHCHYKCTVFYTETIESSLPFPFQCKKRRVEVVYIDKDHFHQCVEGVDAQRSVTRDLGSGLLP